MKKILLLSAILLSVTACKDKATQKDAIENPIAYQEVQAETLSDYEKAKATLDELFLHAESLKKGEISKDKHAALSYPLGQKFKAQKAALNDEDRQLLKEYGNKRYDEVYPEQDRVEVIW